MKKGHIFLSSIVNSKSIRAYLIGVLLLLPVQRKIALEVLPQNAALGNLIFYIDELTIVFFLPLSLFCLYKNRDYRGPVGVVMLSLFLVAVAGVFSGLLNGNPLLVTAAGVFDYIKLFSAIFIYFVFFRNHNDFRMIFRFVLALAVVLGVISIIQELWALGSVYVLGNDLSNPANYLFKGEMNINLLMKYWRFGFYRTSSLMVSTINSGLYLLLILNIYLCTVEKINPLLLISLFGAVFTSISRVAYTGFIAVSGYHILRGVKWLILTFIIVVFIMVFLGSLWDLNIWQKLDISVLDDSGVIGSELYENDSVQIIDDDSSMADAEEVSEEHFREYSRGKALEIWKDHPFLGVGPGMFGGVVSIEFNSPIYKMHNFHKDRYVYDLKSIDNFWPQILAEMGIIGTVLFLSLILSIVFTLFLSSRISVEADIKGLSKGLIIFSIVIIIYTLGLGLNITPVLFTYCAFAGIAIRSANETMKRKIIDA